MSFDFGRSVVKRYDGSANSELMTEFFQDLEKGFVEHNVPSYHKVRFAENYLEKAARFGGSVQRP
jgi:hypothetical protein